MKKRDILEEAVVLLRTNREEICKYLPTTVTLHLPPPDGKDCVILKFEAKARSK